MNRYKLPFNINKDLLHNGHLYPLVFAYKNNFFYHNIEDCSDSTNTIAIDENNNIISGQEANTLLFIFVSEFIKENGPVYISSEFKPLVSRERDIQNK